MVFLSFLPNLPLTICTVFCISNGARLRIFFLPRFPFLLARRGGGGGGGGGGDGGGGREECASQEVIGAAFLPG